MIKENTDNHKRFQRHKEPLRVDKKELLLKSFFDLAKKFPFAVDLIVFALTNNRSCRQLSEGYTH